MADDPHRTHPDSSAAEPPADDTELIAYLDGELDDDEAQAVEARLARDPRARARAEAYKKSFDLLDYLPRTEPSPDFTARTITRLQPALSGSQPVPLGSVSGSGFVPALPARPRKAWPELLAWAVVAALVLTLGYLGHSYARPFLNPPPPSDEPTLSDLEVIERLPLYLGVDDLKFLEQLDQAEHFPDEPANAPAPLAEPAAAADRAKLIALFRAFPPTRQQQLRTLHADLKKLDPKANATVFRTLDAYAAWLDQLPDAERKTVLSAQSGTDRLAAVRQVREAQWRSTLTPRQKELLRNVDSAEKGESLAREWRAQDRTRREEWELAHRQWQLMSDRGQKPWPFNDPKLASQIDGFVKSAFAADLSIPLPDKKGEVKLPPGCRLTREQYLELRALHDAATKEGYWLSYGACLLRLADAHPTLPPPKDGKLVVNIATLPTEYKGLAILKDKDGELRKQLQPHAGKWPDFAEQVHRLVAVRPKGADRLTQLGPCKPGEFADEVNAFLAGPLTKALTGDEKTALEKHLGKWPDYPQKVIELAKRHHLSVPGVTLPGDPAQWDQFYRLAAGKK